MPSALLDRLAEHDADVLDGVMLVDVEVALGVHRQVHDAVPGHQLQHVVQEADAGPHVVAPRPVQVEPDRDGRLAGAPVDQSFAHDSLTAA